MKYTFFTDLHYGTPIEIRDDLVLQEIEGDLFVPYNREIVSNNVYLLGDIIDLKRVKNHRLNYWKEQHKILEKAFFNRYVSGNHELTTKNIDLKLGTKLLTHGDFALWGESQAQNFRAKRAGQGYGLGSKIVQVFRSGHVSKADAKKLAIYARLHCADTIICGHIHPKTIFDDYVCGVRVIVLPRGKTVLELGD